MRDVPVPQSFSGMLADLSSITPCLFVLESPELDSILQVWPHHCRAEGEIDYLSQPADKASPSTGQDITSLLHGKNVLLTHVQVGVHPQVIFWEATFQSDSPQYILVLGVVPP